MDINTRQCSFKPLVLPYGLAKPINWDEQFNRQAPLEVEIGFGMGEVLMQTAAHMPQRNYIGIEQHWERICKTLKKITKSQTADGQSFNNIRILKVDAWVAFERLLASKSVDCVYCLFPCPWPKKKHIKHRLFSNDFLRLLNNRLKKDGQLKIVTDDYSYGEWILKQMGRTGFRIETKTIPSRYDTKFERKWREEGQNEFFELQFLKKRHIHAPFKGDVELKSYMLDNFHAGRLRLSDEKGGISVIFKDMVYDKDKQKVMICALVAEEYLTQHFWISIFKKNGKWRVAKAQGQNFLPTAGIARALDLVYESAKKTCAAGVNS